MQDSNTYTLDEHLHESNVTHSVNDVDDENEPLNLSFKFPSDLR